MKTIFKICASYGFLKIVSSVFSIRSIINSIFSNSTDEEQARTASNPCDVLTIDFIPKTLEAALDTRDAALKMFE